MTINFDSESGICVTLELNTRGTQLRVTNGKKLDYFLFWIPSTGVYMILYL